MLIAKKNLIVFTLNILLFTASVYLFLNKTTPSNTQINHFPLSTTYEPQNKVVEHQTKPEVQPKITESPQSVSNITKEKIKPTRIVETPTSDLATIQSAKEAITSNDINERINGVMVLTQLNPEEAVEGMFTMLDKLDEDPNVEGAIALSMISLANQEDVLTNDQLLDIYQRYENDNLQGRAARVLAQRGDTQLLENHLENMSQKLREGSSDVKIQTLNLIESLETDLSIKHISNYLSDENDDVRFAALNALSRSGNIDNLELVRPLMLDPSIKVQTQAEMVINYFLVKGQEQPVPIDMLHES